MPLSCRSNYTKLFTGSNKDQLIKPNFKLPDPVYDPPKFEANGKTIVTTPSTLTMDGDYNYIYPYLIFRCDEQNKLDLILSSYMQAAYSNGGYHRGGSTCLNN